MSEQLLQAEESFVCLKAQQRALIMTIGRRKTTRRTTLGEARVRMLFRLTIIAAATTAVIIDNASCLIPKIQTNPFLLLPFTIVLRHIFLLQIAQFLVIMTISLSIECLHLQILIHRIILLLDYPTPPVHLQWATDIPFLIQIWVQDRDFMGKSLSNTSNACQTWARETYGGSPTGGN